MTGAGGITAGVLLLQAGVEPLCQDFLVQMACQEGLAQEPHQEGEDLGEAPSNVCCHGGHHGVPGPSN